MRLRNLIVMALLLPACRGPIEERALYSSSDGTGHLFLCDRPNTVLEVRDSALAAAYHRLATAPYQRLFVRLRGVRADSGSIYYSAHYFLVRQVLEIRAPRAGECAGVPDSIPRGLTASGAVPRIPRRF
jgi:hypothetical protein